MALSVAWLEEGFRISIGVERRLLNVLFLASQVLYLGLVSQVVGESRGGMLRGAVVVFGPAIFFIWLGFWFHRDTVTVTRSTTTLGSSIFGVKYTANSYRNSEIRNLRYEEWSGGRSKIQHGVRFDYEGRTITFARQANAADSWDLIDKMRRTYPFPQKDGSE